jgi:hypothetical protein
MMRWTSWQGADDKGRVEFAGDSHDQPEIAVIQFLVDAHLALLHEMII